MKIQQLDSLHSFTDVTSHTRNDLVFEYRFKEYGAYEIRKNYAGAVLWAMLFTFGALVLGIVIPKIISSTSIDDIIPPKTDVTNTIEIVTPVDLTPKVEIIIPKMETSKMPVLETEKFINNIKVIDDTKTAETIKTQQDIDKTVISVVTHDGLKTDKIDVIETDIKTDVIESDINKPMLYVEEMPKFIGGEEALFKYLGNAIHYPEMSKNLGIKGKIIVQFVVGPDGSIQNAKIVKSVKGGAELEQEALRVVKNMPLWLPGKQNGKPVFVQFALPINFVVQ